MLKTLHISVKLKHANSQEEVNKSFSQNMCASAKPHKKMAKYFINLGQTREHSQRKSPIKV